MARLAVQFSTRKNPVRPPRVVASRSTNEADSFWKHKNDLHSRTAAADKWSISNVIEYAVDTAKLLGVPPALDASVLRTTEFWTPFITQLQSPCTRVAYPKMDPRALCLARLVFIAYTLRRDIVVDLMDYYPIPACAAELYGPVLVDIVVYAAARRTRNLT